MGKTVEAERFRLIGKNGNLAAELTTNALSEPALVLFDKAGKSRASLAITGGQAQLNLNDETGKGTVRISVYREGLLSVEIYDSVESLRVEARLREDRSWACMLRHEDGSETCYP